MMKRVVLLAFIGSENLGDEAINYSILLNFARSDYHLDILSFDPTRTEKLVRLAGLNQYSITNISRYKQVKKVIADCDVFVCGGGGIIQDQTSIYNLPFFLYHINLAARDKKKIMLYGVGVGPLTSPILRYFTRLVLSKTQRITVRDDHSKEILIEVGLDPDKIEITADPTLSLPAQKQVELDIDPDKIIFFLSLRKWFDNIRIFPVSISKKINQLIPYRNQKYENLVIELAEVLDRLNQRYDAHFCFFPFWPSRDTEMHRAIVSKMQTNASITLFEDEVNPLEALSIMDNADIAICMRLHSLIFSTLLTKKIIALNYSPKVKGFLSLIFPDSLVNKLSVNPKEFTSKTILEKIEFTLSRDYSNEIGDQVIRLSMKERRNFEVLEELLESNTAGT